MDSTNWGPKPFKILFTTLHVSIKALFPDTPHCALDLLLSTDGLVLGVLLRGLHLLFTGLKWNVNRSFIGKPGPAGIGVFLAIVW
ncbi:hypothetical protein SADUNF_Sadunf02G0122300 [Salix dunnii]|uniref:Uncharacterized protein n=1 Tax=Salix dunnii TaxID=1413687 RepID=A0A835TGV9_9ROSI|nr:hypothetical protein SADUNF_Sadunf02G0122300 [Salix dunnii]